MMLCNSYAANWTCSCQINGQAGPLILLEQASQPAAACSACGLKAVWMQGAKLVSGTQEACGTW